MSVKITVVFLCAAIGTATGYMIMRSLKLRYGYINELCGIVAELKHNIGYRRDGAASIFRSLSITNKQLCKNVYEYIEYASGNTDKPVISKGYLEAETYEAVSGFFGAFGRTDGKSQLDELKMYEDKFVSLKNKAEQKRDKMGAAAVKLGFLIGLGVGILTL